MLWDVETLENAMKNIEKQTMARLNIFEEVGMAQLLQEDTNVPCYIQIRPQPDSKHKVPSIKVSMKPFVQGEKEGVLVVTISDAPSVLTGDAKISSATLVQVYKWVSLNEELLLKYWNKKIHSTKQVLLGLKPI